MITILTHLPSANVCVSTFQCICAGVPSSVCKHICLWQMWVWTPSSSPKHICLWQMCAFYKIKVLINLILYSIIQCNSEISTSMTTYTNISLRLVTKLTQMTCFRRTFCIVWLTLKKILSWLLKIIILILLVSLGHCLQVLRLWYSLIKYLY